MNTLDLMKQYCDESGELYENRKARKEILEYENKVGKSFIEMEEWEIREMFSTFTDQKKKSKSHIVAKTVINDYIGFYSRFFDWCIDKGLVKGTNIFLLSSLSSKEVHRMLSEMYKDEIPILLGEDEFNEICSKCDDIFVNGFYEEIFLRLLYEGVIYRLDEAEGIKVKDVELGKVPTIRVGSRIVKISSRLKELLENLSGESFVIANNTLEAVRIDGSFLYFLCKKGSNANTVATVMRRNFKNLSDKVGVSITPDYIYYSGLYNFILKKTGGDNERVYNMFYDGHYAINSVVKELTQLAGEFGCKKEGKNIRTTVSKYRIDIQK